MTRSLRSAAVTTALFLATAVPLPAQVLGLMQWSTGLGANHHWYAISQIAADYRVVQTLAESLGGYMVSITTPQENSWVYERFIGQATCAPVWCQPGTFYIGLEREVSGGRFHWNSGEVFAWAKWAPGEPNDQGDERVAHLFRRNGELFWNDIAYNSNPMRGVIEWDERPDLTTTPEPASMALLGTGLLALGAMGVVRRRRRG